MEEEGAALADLFDLQRSLRFAALQQLPAGRSELRESGSSGLRLCSSAGPLEEPGI